MKEQNKNFTYIIYKKEIEFNSIEEAYHILYKLEQKFKNLFFSGFNAYENGECPIYMIRNSNRLQPCFCDNEYQQFKFDKNHS